MPTTLGIDRYLKSLPVRLRQQRFEDVPEEAPRELTGGIFLGTEERPSGWEQTKYAANALQDFLFGRTPKEVAAGDLLGAVMPGGTPLMLRGPVANAVYNPRTQQELIERVLAQLEGVHYDNPLQAFLLSDVLKKHPRLTAAYGHHGGTIKRIDPARLDPGQEGALGIYHFGPRSEEGWATASFRTKTGRIVGDTSREMGPLTIVEPSAERTLVAQLRDLEEKGLTDRGSSIPVSVGAHEVGHLAQDLPERRMPYVPIPREIPVLRGAVGEGETLGLRTSPGLREQFDNFSKYTQAKQLNLAQEELGARITGANQMIRFLNPTMKAKERMHRALGDALLTQSWKFYIEELPPTLPLSIQGRKTTVGEVLRWLDDPTPDAPFLPKDFKFHSGPAFDRQRLHELQSRDRSGIYRTYEGGFGFPRSKENLAYAKDLEDIVRWKPYVGVNWDRRSGLGNMPDQLELSEATGGKGFTVQMSPEEYRALVPEFTNRAQDTYALERTATEVKRRVAAGEPIAPPFLTVVWDDAAKVWRVESQEGRSRTATLQELGVFSMPVDIITKRIADTHRKAGVFDPDAPTTRYRIEEITPEQRRAPVLPLSARTFYLDPNGELMNGVLLRPIATTNTSDESISVFVTDDPTWDEW